MEESYHVAIHIVTFPQSESSEENENPDVTVGIPTESVGTVINIIRLKNCKVKFAKIKDRRENQITAVLRRIKLCRIKVDLYR